MRIAALAALALLAACQRPEVDRPRVVVENAGAAPTATCAEALVVIESGGFRETFCARDDVALVCDDPSAHVAPACVDDPVETVEPETPLTPCEEFFACFEVTFLESDTYPNTPACQPFDAELDATEACVAVSSLSGAGAAECLAGSTWCTALATERDRCIRALERRAAECNLNGGGLYGGGGCGGAPTSGLQARFNAHCLQP
jgi:hypothetical protein